MVHEEDTQGSVGRTHLLQQKGAGKQVRGRGPGSSFQSRTGMHVVPPAPMCAACAVPALGAVQRSDEVCGLGWKSLGSNPSPAAHWLRGPGRVADLLGSAHALKRDYVCLLGKVVVRMKQDYVCLLVKVFVRI